MKAFRLPLWSLVLLAGTAALALQLLWGNTWTKPRAGSRLAGVRNRVRIAITIDHWRSWVPAESTHRLDSLVVEARKGEDFGPLQVGHGGKLRRPFRLLDILDRNRVRIGFDESLVVCGEGISNPSKQNPIAVTAQPTCFRTRSSDSGTDYILRLAR